MDKIKVFFASGDDKGIREHVRLFLQDKSIGFEQAPADFRKLCLVELKTAKQAGLLTAQNLSPNDVARQVASFQRYADPKGLVDGAVQMIGQIADEFASEYPNLGQLLRQRPAGGAPLLVSAFAYFFRREVETNDELAHGLFFDGLRQLSAAQDNSFGEVSKALISLGDQFEQVFEQLDRIETVVVETHGAVLDMQAELQRLGSLHLGNADEVRRLMQEVLNRVSRVGMQKGEVKPQHSFSIRSEDERTAIKQLLARFRQLPVQQQKQVPALLNGLGKLQFGSGNFDGARQTFEAVAGEVHDASAQAEAHFNAYRAALEEKKWGEALDEIQKTAALDANRFAPFPMERYQAKRILGAGGFGTAFLCHDHNLNIEVVVKTLHDAALERNVFQEAHLLKDLSHAAIIRVRAVAYCDKALKVRPYIVMDYFPGESLESRIQNDGTLKVEDLVVIVRQIAQGMRFAHQKNIFHRDLKPDNVLVCKTGDGWKVKIIDFGLAMRKQTIETSMAARSAGKSILGDSVAGTIKYAPPEQLGDMIGVKPGPYSDVYSFGKMCCYALFKTTKPKDRHWEMIQKDIRTNLKKMLEQCKEEELEHRLPNFEPVLKVLEALDPMQAQRNKDEESRQEAELERTRREQEETDRQRQELERLQKEGETKRTLLVREALDRTQGKPTKDDTAAANGMCKQHLIDKERAKQIVEEVREQWQKAHAPKSERSDPVVFETRQPVQAKLPNRRWFLVGAVGSFSLVSLVVMLSLLFGGSSEKMRPDPMKFAWIPPGTFLMGSPNEEKGRGPDEILHKVTLTKGFYMGIHAVTQEQWQAVMGNNPSYFKGEKNLPVDSVSWEDCQEFIKKLRKKDKKLYRLPTEAEREYACRAGTETPFHFGETIFTHQANYDRKKTTPVGRFPANAFGLFDMHGNVWEWCQDWSGDYPKNDVVDPQGVNAGTQRVLRGGSWFGNPVICRSASRDRDAPGRRDHFVGCRLCFYVD